MHAPITFIIASLLPLVASQALPAASIAAQNTLPTSTSLPFPTSTLPTNDTQAFLISSWSLARARIQNHPDNLDFVADPFPNNPVPVTSNASSNPAASSPVLRVNYPKGSFSNNTGGSQFFSLWNNSAPFQSMLLSYEIAFDADFDFVKGGKIPGLRGGLDSTGCSGGDKPDGSKCFSARLMWRTRGAGEVYAYIPTPNGLCDQSNIICNSDFGTSIGRGDFGFPTGQWSRISLLVRLNDPPNVANGLIEIYFNDVHAISQSGLQLRSKSEVDIGGLFFSTFFGGSDDSWASTADTHTYFRNFQLWGSTSPSVLSGEPVKSAATPNWSKSRVIEWGWIIFVAVLAFFCGLELV